MKDGNAARDSASTMLQPRAGQLRRRREELGLTQPSVARSAGVGQTTISRLERIPTASVSRGHATRIAAALSVDLDRLFKPRSMGMAERAAHRRLAGRWGHAVGSDGLPVMLEARPGRLRERRVTLSLTQTAVDDAAGVARGTTSRLEGVRGFVLGQERACQIAAALSTELDELFTAQRTQRSRRGTRRVPPMKRGAPTDYMRDELARIETEANARGLLTIDQVCTTFRRAAAASAEEHRRRWRPNHPHVLPTMTRQGIDYYVRRGDLEVAERVSLSTGKEMRLFRASDVDELARTRFAFPNGNVREWEKPTAAVRAGPAELLSGRARQKVKGRWSGELGGRRPAREKDPDFAQKAEALEEIRQKNPRMGERALAEYVGLSRRQIRALLRAS